MANDDNLKPFLPGDDARRQNGRIQGSKNRATIARKWLDVEEKTTNDLTGVDEVLSEEDRITLALLKKARLGDVFAYNALMASAYGAPNQKTEVTGKDGEPLIINFVRRG